MIIGISGRIGSGKDTVGLMIQRLTLKKIDTYNEDEFGRAIYGTTVKTSWEIKKYAAKLKQTASLLLGIPAHKFEDQDFKKTKLGAEWGHMTVREFLQKLGTEGVRNGVHTNAWVNALFADYKDEYEMSTYGHTPKYPNWIITDMRFPNEMDGVKERGGVCIRIVRKLPDQDYTTLEALHPSETALDNEEFDYTIYNNGSLDELWDRVSEILKDMNHA